MYHAPPSVLAHFTAAVHQTAIKHRKRNSTQGTHAMPHPYYLTQTPSYQHAWPFLPDPPNPHTSSPNEKKTDLKSSAITGPQKYHP